MLVVQQGCHACDLLVDELPAWLDDAPDLMIVTQDAGYPGTVAAVHDTDLAWSRRLQLEGTPALLRLRGGEVVDRVEGWDKARWRQLSGRPSLGRDLPDVAVGCASKSIDPTRPAARRLQSRHVRIGEHEDPAEAVHARGWSDGLPVVPPTVERVERMLAGTRRDPAEVVAVLPPDFAEVTVEKAAVNAVLAGCLPEYLPVVLAAVEAVGSDTFNIHGVAATTHFVSPVIVVNGPIAAAIGMNSGINALGQGNRANLTIGRAVNLIIRNVGGARPGEIDRATLGGPGKIGFCFAEDEAGSPWEPLARERGVPQGTSAVTLFAGTGPQPVVDQRSRSAASLAGSLALSLQVVWHPKLVARSDALVIISPEHAAVFRRDGWDKARLRQELLGRLTLPADDLLAGAGGITEGLPPAAAGSTVTKFLPDGLWFVHAGGPAGQFSAILPGWVNGPKGSQMTTVPIRE